MELIRNPETSAFAHLLIKTLGTSVQNDNIQLDLQTSVLAPILLSLCGTVTALELAQAGMLGQLLYCHAGLCCPVGQSRQNQGFP